MHFQGMLGPVDGLAAPHPGNQSQGLQIDLHDAEGGFKGVGFGQGHALKGCVVAGPQKHHALEGAAGPHEPSIAAGGHGARIGVTGVGHDQGLGHGIFRWYHHPGEEAIHLPAQEDGIPRIEPAGD